jgi:hypothetical protein
MKKLIIPIAIISALTVTTLHAQNEDGIKQEGAHEAEYNADSEVRDRSADVDSRVENNDTLRDQSNAGNQDNTERFNDEATAPSSPWGDSRTVSSSGSPGVLAKDETATDGTNTMQKAEPNIAGSPIPGARKSKTSGKNPQNDERSENRRFGMEEQKSVPNNAQRKQSEAKKTSAAPKASGSKSADSRQTKEDRKSK